MAKAFLVGDLHTLVTLLVKATVAVAVVETVIALTVRLAKGELGALVVALLLVVRHTLAILLEESIVTIAVIEIVVALAMRLAERVDGALIIAMTRILERQKNRKNWSAQQRYRRVVFQRRARAGYCVAGG